MTVQQAIERADQMKAGNAVSDDLKIQWLQELDEKIYHDYINRHILPKTDDSRWWSQDDDGNWVFADCPAYDSDSVDDELIAEVPDENIYVYWLMAKIDLFSQEYDKFNNDNALFEQAYSAFTDRFKRTYRPIPYPNIKVGVFR